MRIGVTRVLGEIASGTRTYVRSFVVMTNFGAGAAVRECAC